MLKFVNHRRGIIYRKRDKNNKRKRVNVVIVVSCVKTCCVLVFDDLMYLYISLIGDYLMKFEVLGIHW
jgi:hypothetical protein